MDMSRSAPIAQHSDPPDHRHQGHTTFAHVLDNRQVAPLGVGIVAVDIATEHQSTLVRLADVEMACAERYHAGNERLDWLRHKGLDDVALDRQREPGHGRHA